MRIAYMLTLCGAALLSGCWTSYCHRVDLQESPSSRALRNRYCIKTVKYSPWPCDKCVSNESFEYFSGKMEKALREVHPELFVPTGTPIAVSLKCIDAESDVCIPLGALNALVSLATLGMVPVAGGGSQDLAVSVDLCRKDDGRKFRVRAENCCSMGIIPVALLRSYAEPQDAYCSIVGKSGLAERDRRSELMMAKAFGASVIQLLLSHEESLPTQTSVRGEEPTGTHVDPPDEKENQSDSAVIEINEIPL